MKAGDLRQAIMIVRPVTGPVDAKGNKPVSWQAVASVRASVSDVSGRDFYAAQAYQAQDVVTFGIRWRDDVTPDCRVLFGGQAYTIEQINHLGYRKDYMHIKARLTKGKEA